MSETEEQKPLREYAATGKERFIRVYDKETEFMNGPWVYPASLVEGKTHKEIAEQFSYFGFKQMYICDVSIWEGDRVREYRDPEGGNYPNVFLLDNGHFTNERKITALTPQEQAVVDSYAPLLTAIKSEVVSDQAKILAPFGGSKTSYFQKRGIALPTTMEDRKALAQELGQSIFHNNDPDNLHEVMFMLFDPAKDPFDDAWVHKIANEYDREGPRFKPDKANQLYIYSGLTHEGWLGACGAFYLGKKFLFGHEREIDPNIAAKWFELAVDKGHPAPRLFLSSIYKRYDPRYRAPGHEEFTERVDNLLKNSKAPPVFHQYTVDTIWRGIDAAAQTQAVVNFQEMADGWSPYRIPSRWHIAMRAMLGLGRERDLVNVQEYLEQLPDIDDATQGVVQYSAEKDNLQEMLTAAKAPTTAEAYKQAAQAVCKWYTEEDGGQAVQALIDRTPTDKQRPIRDTLWLTTSLADKEEWRIEGQIGWKLYEMRMQQAGVKLEDLKQSALIMGPRYNAIGENGLPLLGAWEQPSPNPTVAMQEMAQRGSYVPATGVGIFQGLTTTPDGYIQFKCGQSGGKPGLLFQEDFDVAMVLAFGDEKKIIWPSLSMEDADKKLTDGHEVFRTKEFSPEWMGYTDFGRTMYITDVLSGALAWNSQRFPLAAATTDDQKRRNEQIASFLKYISWTGGRSTRSTSSRVMVRTEHVHIEGRDPKIVKKQKVWDMTVKAVKMRVDGSYILKRTNGEENRLVALNDTTYQQGAVTQKLTDNYDYIAGIIPVFERARQLMGLFYSLTELQKAGFRPNPKLMAELKTKYDRYAKLPKLPRNQLWAKPFPHG